MTINYLLKDFLRKTRKTLEAQIVHNKAKLLLEQIEQAEDKTQLIYDEIHSVELNNDEWCEMYYQTLNYILKYGDLKNEQ